MAICVRVMWRIWLRYSLRSILMAFFIALVTLHIITHRSNPDVDLGSRDLGEGDRGWPSNLQQGEHQRHQQRAEFIPEDYTLGPRGDWIEVSGSKRDVFLYSAYWDRRAQEHYVRIIAITRKRKKVQGCDVLLSDKRTERVTAHTKIIRENWNLAYSASFIVCHLLNQTLTPVSISVVLDSKNASSTSIPVQDLANRKVMGNMSVCVKPFHYDFDRAVWLVEFIEFYRLLGADKFIFYNHTMGANLEAVLGYYQRQGVVKILPWSLPVVTQKEIRTEGIFAALNDCNLRSVGRYSLAAMVDVDEFLIPRKHPDLLQLVNSYGDKDNAYVFQNVFFYLYWENDTAVHDALFADQDSLGYTLFGSEASMPYLLTAYKTTRLKKPHKHGQRSKYLVRPERVLEVGNHQVWEHVGMTRYNNIPPELGLSHHYRICEFGGFDCLKAPKQVDSITHQWLAPLAKLTAASCSQIFPTLGRCPVAPPLGSPW